MARCVGTTNGKAASAVMSGADVFVETSHNTAQVHLRNQRGEVVRRFAIEDERVILSLAHQLLGAYEALQERKDIQ